MEKKLFEGHPVIVSNGFTDRSTLKLEGHSISKIDEKSVPEPLKERLIVDLDQFWTELDALVAGEFLPEDIPDDPPAEPDPRIFFDDDLPP